MTEKSDFQPRISRKQVDRLRLSLDEFDDLIQNMGRAVGELQCVVELLEHPKRNRKNLKEWCRNIHELGWMSSHYWPEVPCV